MWSAPEQLNGLLQSYTLKWTEAPNKLGNIFATSEESVSLPPDTTTYMAAGLDPSQTYQFFVTATTGGGEGNYASDTGTAQEFAGALLFI